MFLMEHDSLRLYFKDHMYVLSLDLQVLIIIVYRLFCTKSLPESAGTASRTKDLQIYLRSFLVTLTQQIVNLYYLYSEESMGLV